MAEPLVHQATIPPNSGMAFEVARGQQLRVAGTTIADFVAFNRHDLRERFDQARTKTYNSKIWISTGDVLMTKANNPLLTIIADTYAGQVPTILKMNSANSLAGGMRYDQAVTSSVKDALRLGCVGVGFTIYPGSEACYDQMEELRDIIREARASGLVSVVWSYPRGGKVSKDGETALDIVAYAAHMAALMGAHVIKVKPPKAAIDLDAAKPTYEKARVPMETLKERIAHVMQCCFAGKRLVVFSGGEAKGTEGLLEDIRQIRDGGGHGSIIGRNSFQRPHQQALELLDQVVKIYLGQA